MVKVWDNTLGEIILTLEMASALRTNEEQVSLFLQLYSFKFSYFYGSTINIQKLKKCSYFVSIAINILYELGV